MPHRTRTTRSSRMIWIAAIVAAGCVEGGSTPPPGVAEVNITSHAAPITINALSRTVQFTGVAVDGSGLIVSDATLSWSSLNNAVATISAGGVLTAVGIGSTTVTASADGHTSDGVQVTVQQIPASVVVAPIAVTLNALNAQRQLTASRVDSAGVALIAVAVPTWSRAGAGLHATVGADGLVTGIAVGAGDTAVATIAGLTGRAAIVVQQVPATVTISPPGVDTLRTTGRTRQYTAVVNDSGANAIPGAAVQWSSNAPAAATIGATTGLATAVSDGNAIITATSGSATAQTTLAVRRFASTFSMTPPNATITTPLGTQIFLGTAEDSVATALPIAWVSRNTVVFGVSAASGTQVTATAAGNGAAYLVMTAGTRRDSALVTVSGQIAAPLTASVNVGAANVFASVRNGSANPAVDTIAVGGTVTWVGQGGNHNVQSTGAPNFPSSINPLGVNSHVHTFNAAGTYQYECIVHGNLMSGRIVVR